MALEMRLERARWQVLRRVVSTRAGPTAPLAILEPAELRQVASPATARPEIRQLPEVAELAAIPAKAAPPVMAVKVGTAEQPATAAQPATAERPATAETETTRFSPSCRAARSRALCQLVSSRLSQPGLRDAATDAALLPANRR